MGRQRIKIIAVGTSLAVQWLRLHASSAEDVDSVSSQGTRISHVVWHGKKKNNNKLKIILDGNAKLHSSSHLNFTHTHKPTIDIQGRYTHSHFIDERQIQ